MQKILLTLRGLWSYDQWENKNVTVSEAFSTIMFFVGPEVHWGNVRKNWELTMD